MTWSVTDYSPCFSASPHASSSSLWSPSETWDWAWMLTCEFSCCPESSCSLLQASAFESAQNNLLECRAQVVPTSSSYERASSGPTLPTSWAVHWLVANFARFPEDPFDFKGDLSHRSATLTSFREVSLTHCPESALWLRWPPASIAFVCSPTCWTSSRWTSGPAATNWLCLESIGCFWSWCSHSSWN